MFCPQTSPDTHNAISSPGSGFGLWRSDAPDGPTIDLFGQVPARANLSARQAKEVRLMTSGTFGPHGTTSLPSENLRWFLASRLQPLTDTLGSTLFKLTWKQQAYAFGPVVLPAAGVGAPHGRHRIFFVADAMQSRWAKRRASPRRGQAAGSGCAVRVADADMPEPDGGRAPGGEQPLCNERGGCTGTVEHAESEQARVSRLARERRATGGHWADADWLPCQGGKWRPIEPGTFPLAHGVACRMDKLRAFGNAISPQVAEAFIGAYLESRRWQDGDLGA